MGDWFRDWLRRYLLTVLPPPSEPTVVTVERVIVVPADVEEDLRPFKGLALFTGGLLILVFLLIWSAAQAFDVPSANSRSFIENEPSLTLAVGATSSSGTKSPLKPSELSADMQAYYEGGEVTYSLSLPAALAGREVLLELQGTAVLNGPINTRGLKFRASTQSCQPVNRKKSKCQLIYASLPRDPSQAQAIVGQFCPVTDQASSQMVIAFSGRSSYEHRSFWAHKWVGLPVVIQGFPRSVVQMSGIALDGPYQPIQPTTCFFVRPDNNLEFLSAAPAPSDEVLGGLRWEGLRASLGVAAVFKRHSTEAWANAMLAAAGIVAALAIAYVPIADDARRRNRRKKKARTGT